MNKITVVDQSSIPASFRCVSLFVNDKHIIDSDESNDYPIQDVANSLAVALNCDVKTIDLSQVELARFLAKKAGNEAALNVSISDGDDLDEYVQGYSNDDIIELIAESSGTTHSILGLQQALKDLDGSLDDLTLYECEIGLFDQQEDPNTAFDTVMVVVAAENKEEANESARFLAEQNTATCGDVSFAPMDLANEVNSSDYR